MDKIIRSTKEDLIKNRLDWVNKAHKEFVGLLKDDYLSEIVERQEKGETYTVVYGRAQVGKTSLILKLLGIRDDSYDVVSKVLRGGRKIGESSTVTTMIYCKSYDNKYRVKYDQEYKNFTDNKEVEGFFSKLRNKITDNSFRNEKEIEIMIPKRFFYDNSDECVNIVDLPGIESSDSSEKEIVNELYRKYLPMCGKVYIVEEINQILYLNKLNKTLFWTDYPDKYRIVLTKCISNDSIKKKIMSVDKLNKHSYLNLIYAELEGTFKKDMKNKCYPVEVGKSFNELRENNPNVFEKTESIINELINELREDVCISLSDFNLFTMNTRISSQYRENIEKEKQKFQKELKKINNVIKEVENDKKKCESVSKNLNRDIEKLKSKVNETALNIMIKSPIRFKPFTEVNGNKGIKKKDIKNLFEEYEKEFKRNWREFSKKSFESVKSDDEKVHYINKILSDLPVLKISFEKLDINKTINILNAASNEITRLITGNVSCRFKYGMFDSKSKLIRKFESEIETMEEELSKQVNKIIEEINRLKFSIKKNIDDRRSELRDCNDLINKKEKYININMRERSNIEKSRDEFELRTKKELENLNNRTLLIEKEFKNNLIELTNSLNESKNDIESINILEKISFMIMDYSYQQGEYNAR
ncbi:hypothetical protein SAMN02745751_03130 [Dethiosulfatibacter aminovorans DSM 17477]|uniref:Dynamin family protein n=1 Tax=Dethiosulfatibacter aminovorans DSM 17477 TaxID=1121476 RepID=A0A1M6LBU1_9FIRM|nr:hypothetical protein [Dethiosulfatibacter aminovorans]SHJ68628.1 hypothetical protein SAMN02745751_03130 [Dethiosulfatibacter aminovorans DSM 17477]